MAEENKSLQEQMQGLLKATAETLEMKTKDQLSGIVLSVETINQQLSQMARKGDIEIVGQLKKDIDQLNENLQKNQPIIDNFIAEQGKRQVEKKDFGGSFADSIKELAETRADEIKNFQTDRKAKLVLDLKVGTMVIANVTGDTVQSYNSRQGLLPSQNPNMRDLIPTTISPTGSFVTYRETGTSGSISQQTENQTKTEIDYSFTEVKTVSKYIAGWTKFSKQLMYALPFLQNTLPRILLRDFYKVENEYFYTTMAQAATGVNTIPGAAVTQDAEEILMMIANQRQANYDASYALVDWNEWARVLATKPGTTTTNYSIPGGVTFDPDGRTRIAGTPLVAASWAETDHVMVFDRDYVERVETESLRVEFSYEDDKNFQFNLVTARVECFEDLNILRPDSIIYRDLGNS